MSGQPEKVSSLLRAWRDRNGWKQAFAARKLGVKLSTYQNWERGRCEPQSIGREALMKTINESTSS